VQSQWNRSFNMVNSELAMLGMGKHVLNFDYANLGTI
jgi:hypothetical protein